MVYDDIAFCLSRRRSRVRASSGPQERKSLKLALFAFFTCYSCFCLVSIILKDFQNFRRMFHFLHNFGANLLQNSCRILQKKGHRK